LEDFATCELLGKRDAAGGKQCERRGRASFISKIHFTRQVCWREKGERRWAGGNNDKRDKSAKEEKRGSQPIQPGQGNLPREGYCYLGLGRSKNDEARPPWKGLAAGPRLGGGRRRNPGGDWGGR